jgi:catechol 2,3-dioxygenase-like lactoylglutathione lyase family enzyme
MPIRGIDHVAITVADVESSVSFYSRVLGANPLYLAEWRAGKIPVVILQVGASRLSVHAAAAPAKPHAERPTPGAVDLCFRWDGPLSDAEAHLAAFGIDVVEGPVPRPAADGKLGASVYFRDLDGNLLELLSTEGPP